MNKRFNKLSAGKKGFTIIELIVVIAIIAILASIVLVNVTQYINKSKDGAAIADLDAMRTNAGAFFASNNGTYNGFETGATYTTVASCTATGIDSSFTTPCVGLINAGYDANGSTTTGIVTSCDVASCGSGATKWCAMVTLKATTNTYCIDSSSNVLNKAGGTCSSGVCN